VTPTTYIGALSEPRRSEVRKLHELIREAAPKLKARSGRDPRQRLMSPTTPALY
jgi:hypothetical protein